MTETETRVFDCYDGVARFFTLRKALWAQFDYLKSKNVQDFMEDTVSLAWSYAQGYEGTLIERLEQGLAYEIHRSYQIYTAALNDITNDDFIPMQGEKISARISEKT